MNWMRTILDGFAMAAYFNLFAAAVALYNPRLMFPSYPACYYHERAGTTLKNRESFLPALDLFWGAAASPALWRGQYHGGRDNRILASGPDRVYPVDDGQFL